MTEDGSEWLKRAERSQSERAKNATPLSPQLQARELLGVRIFVVTRVKTGARAPLTVLFGKDYPTYDAFMDAVEAFQAEFTATHSAEKDGLSLSDYWALSVDDFNRDHPDWFA